MFLKQIRQDQLSPAGVELFSKIFDWFSAKDRIQKAEGGPRQNVPYRRFAGGADLPRSRYYTLCKNADGWDRGTLIRELQAYYGLHNIRDIFLYDSCDSFERYGLSDDARNTTLKGLEGNTIRAVLHTNDLTPSAHVDFFKTISKLRGAIYMERANKSFEIPIPDRVYYLNRLPDEINRNLQERFSTIRALTIVDMKIAVTKRDTKNVFDLREINKLKEFIDILFEGAEGFAFQYGQNVLAPHLLLKNDPYEKLSAVEMKDRILAFNAANKLEDAHIYSFPNSGSCPRATEKTLESVLPFIWSYSYGGNAITDSVGRLLRRRQYSGLIYPSARSNCHVAYKDERVMDWDGFCFVDYVNAPRVGDGLHIIVEPEHVAKLYEYDTILVDRNSSQAVDSWALTRREDIEFIHAHYLDKGKILLYEDGARK